MLREYWLQDEGGEPGAAVHRFKCEAIRKDKGGAISYVAKYIGKGIDDAGAVSSEGHHDTDHEGQADWVGGNAKARRIETDPISFESAIFQSASSHKRD